MPVTKKNGNGRGRKKKATNNNPFVAHDPSPIFHGSEFARRIFLTLLGVLLVYAIFWVGTQIRNNIEQYNYIGQAPIEQRTFTLDAQAKVTARPDIAVTTIGMIATGDTVADAQEQNTAVMNTLIERLKEAGVAEEDIQTANYNIYPQYNYTEEEGRILEGYEVNQSVRVKIRDLENANQILALAGEVGANSVSGLQFTIDDRDVYRSEARKEALTKVFRKAKDLSKALGVDLVRVVSYDEHEAGESSPVMYREDMSAIGASPQVEPGTMDVRMNVSVTFEIR